MYKQAGGLLRRYSTHLGSLSISGRPDGKAHRRGGHANRHPHLLSLDVVRGEIGGKLAGLLTELAGNFSACDEGVNEEAVAVETSISRVLTQSVQGLLSASRVGITDNLYHA